MALSKHKKSNINTKYLIAHNIIDSKSVEKPEILLSDAPRQPSFFCNACKICKSGYVILDFGIEICGGVSVTIKEVSKEGAKLRLVFGESVAESLSDIGCKNATNDHAVRDTVVPVSLLSTYKIGQTGFRFVKIEAQNADITISCVQAISKLRNIKQLGYFQCSDKMLTDVWNTAVRTVHLNMQEYIWDGIKRDRLVWVGDLHPEISTICCAFGYNSLVDKTLDFALKTTPAGEWINSIPSYSLWWLIIQNEWYINNGKKQILTGNRKLILPQIKQILDRVDNNGTLNFDDYFIDWETSQCDDQKLGFMAILMLALKAAKSICDILEEYNLSSLCSNKISLVQNCHSSDYKNQQIAALLGISGIRDINEINSFITNGNQIKNTTAFLGYYTLIAKGKAGDIKGALDIIQGYWGKMIELGATTFWESFEIEDSIGAVGIDKIVKTGEKDIHGDSGEYCYKQFRKSLCHGWASGPAPFLSRYVLGINPIEVGCRTVEIKPNLANLAWAKGAYPTPYGNIEIEITNDNGMNITKLKAPNEVKIRM